MKIVKNELPTSIDSLVIEVFADLHIGSKKCNYQLIHERIESVKNDPNVYCIILGDLINNSTKTSVGDVYEEPLSPMQQIKQAVEMFRPIKDKVLAITSGNHERRSYKSDGTDLLYFFSAELGLADRYDYAACLSIIRFGQGYRNRKIAYSLYMTHGDGQGGRTIGGKANGLQRRGQIIDADIIVTGHTHSPITFKDCYYSVNYQNNAVIKKEQLYVNTGAALDYEEYAEIYGMKPSSYANPKIILNGYKKDAIAIM